LKFSFIEGNSAPKARVRHLIVNPKWDPEEEKRESYTSVALKAAKELLKNNQKILIFGNSHSVVERIGLMAKEAGMRGIKVYRAGLDRDLRRKLELEFKAGKTNALVTTSALELGMDIGAVDSIILAGFPGTITRVKQRAGRAGRRGREATGVFIARDNPLDQYYAENTREYLKGEPEDCYVNPSNESILKSHLLAMMRDYPADLDEVYNFSKSAKGIFKELKENEMVKEFAGGWIPTKKGLKELREMNIRTASEPIRIYDLEAKKFIGEREEAMALSELFPGAIYLHAGEKYLSKELDLERRVVYVSKIIYDVSEYTLALRERTAEVVEVYDERKVFGGKLSYGKVHINDEIYAYVIKDYLKNTTSEKMNLEKPLNYEFDSLAIWMDYPSRLLEVEDFPNGLHAVEHVSIAMVPALTGADPNELGGISYPAGRMYIYDGVPNGSGLAKIIYEKFERVQKMAHGRLRSCRCRNGCPSCILDPQCGNNNRYLNKKAAIEILEKLKR
jgi:DEAD/DEAH box helicase domain-containing protein